MRTGKIASVAEYRIDEQLKNFLIFGIFQLWNSGNLSILQFGKFQKFPV